MPPKIHNAVRRVPLWLCLLSALLCGSISVYCVTVAWNAEPVVPMVRITVALFGILCGSLLRSCGGLTGLCDFGQGVWNRFRSRPLSEYLIVPVIIGILAALLFPVKTDCGRVSQGHVAASHLKRCGVAMIQYAQVHHDRLPMEMRVGEVKLSLNQYTPNYPHQDDLFTDPISHRPFTWRSRLSGLPIRNVVNASEVMVAYSPEPFNTADPRRAVLFLDGHVKIMREDLFQQSRHVNPIYSQRINKKP